MRPAEEASSADTVTTQPATEPAPDLRCEMALVLHPGAAAELEAAPDAVRDEENSAPRTPLGKTTPLRCRN
jgi:hypothetical protein